MVNVGWWREGPGGVCSRQSIMLLLHHRLPVLPGGGGSTSWTIDLIIVLGISITQTLSHFNGKALLIRRRSCKNKTKKTKKGKSKSRKSKERFFLWPNTPYLLLRRLLLALKRNQKKIEKRKER